jgi:hypothetical protein
MIRMLSQTTLLAVLVAFAAVACAPPALDPDHASGSSADSTGSKSSKKKKSSSKESTDDDDDDDTTGDDTGSSSKTTKQTTNGGGAAATTDTPAVPASFAAVYNGLQTSCGTCHLSGAAGAPTFFGDSEASTYDKFVNQNFNTSPSPLVTKGQHSGPALTSAQQSAVEAWVAADPAP